MRQLMYTGEIAFGDANEHLLRFRTVGQGHMIPELESEVIAGTASWRVEGGEGRFTNGQGFITSKQSAIRAWVVTSIAG